MSEHKFTKGPWEARKGLVFFANGAGGLSVRECPDPVANANLIAAAPDLLEALELLYAHARLHMHVSDNVEWFVESTFKKALGG